MKNCPKCGYNGIYDTSEYCPKCGTEFSNGSNNTLDARHHENNKLKLLIIADLILILIFFPLYSLAIKNFGSVIMIYFLAFLVMIGITVKMIIAKNSDGKDVTNSAGNDNKALETGFILEGIKPRF